MTYLRFFHSCGLITWDTWLSVADPWMAKILCIYKFPSVFFIFFINYKEKRSYSPAPLPQTLTLTLYLCLKRTGMLLPWILCTNWTWVPLNILEGQRKILQFTLSLSLSPLLPIPWANSGQADGFGAMPHRLTDVHSDAITRGQNFSIAAFKPNIWSVPQQKHGVSDSWSEIFQDRVKVFSK